MNPFGSSSSESEEEVEEEVDLEMWRSYPNKNLKDVREVLEEEDLLRQIHRENYYNGDKMDEIIKDVSETWKVNYIDYSNEILKHIRNKNFNSWVTDAIEDVNKDLDLKDWYQNDKVPIKIRRLLEFNPFGLDNSFITRFFLEMLITEYIFDKEKTRSPLESLIYHGDFKYRDRLLFRYLYYKIQSVKDDRSYGIAMLSDKQGTGHLDDDTRGVIREYIGGSKKDPTGVDPKVSSSFQGKSVW